MRTRFKAKILPYGALPYSDIALVKNMMTKLFSAFPYLPCLPNISEYDTIEYRTLCGMPGIVVEGKKISLQAGTQQYEREMSDLERIFNNPSKYPLDQYAFEAPFLEEYLDIIKTFKSPNACISLLGPFTVSQLLMNIAKEQVLADKSYRKIFVQAIYIKALWIIQKIKEYNPAIIPVIILEEPMLGRLSTVKRENDYITTELVINMLERVIEKLHKAGAIVGVQCMEKCDWNIPINAGVDIISFDAYNNPNNLNIISEQIKKFLYRGGKISWGIVPVGSEKLIKDATVEAMFLKFSKTIEGLYQAGVPISLIQKSSIIALNNDADKLPIMFSEKALLIATQLASKLVILY